MLSVEWTKRKTGVTIVGDAEDFYQLTDAIYMVTIDEDDRKRSHLIEMSTRVLGFCYDVRHAGMGDRDVRLVENGMNRDLMRAHGIVASEKNVYYSVNVLFPEMVYVTFALNQLLTARAITLAKKKSGTYARLHPLAIWDAPNAILLHLQAQFARCVSSALTPPSYQNWLKELNDYHSPEQMCTQYLDLWNMNWLNMSPEKREKSVLSVTRRIAQFAGDSDHISIRKVVDEAAHEYGISRDEVEIEGIDYPDEDQMQW